MSEFSLEQKEKFAKAWVNIDDPFAAALSLFHENDHDGRVLALKMASFLTKDPETLELVKKYRNTDEELESLPSKGKFAREVWQVANSLSPLAFPDEKLKFMRLFAETLGYVGTKGNVEINNNNVQELPTAPVYNVVSE